VNSWKWRSNRIRIGIICLVLTLCLAGFGVGYGYWQGTLNIEGTVATGNIACSFTNATTDDPPGLTTSPTADCDFTQQQPQTMEFGQLTTNDRYDRNPSFFESSDGSYWLFFMRATDGLPHQPPTYDPDMAPYDVYWLTSSDGGVSWTEAGPIPNTTDQRGMAAFQDDADTIWVVTSAPEPGGDSNIYYNTTIDGSVWSGFTDTGFDGSHVDGFQDRAGNIWIFWEGMTGGIRCAYSSDYGSSWSAEITVNATGGIPKAMQDTDHLYRAVWCQWPEGKIYQASSVDGVTWADGEIVDVSGTTMCDPVLWQNASGNFWLFYAPRDATAGDNGSQWIEFMASPDTTDWTAPVRMTSGGLAPGYWWDMWPEPFEDSEGNVLLFYTSESNDAGDGRINGNIWQLKIDPGAWEWQCTYAGTIWDFLNAQTEPIIEPDGKTITVILSNAWPCYYPTVYFDITNSGSIPVKIQSIVVDTPMVPYDCDGDASVEPGEETEAITAEITGISVGMSIDPGSTVSGELHIHSTDAIIPAKTYQFSVTFTLWNWNEVAP